MLAMYHNTRRSNENIIYSRTELLSGSDERRIEVGRAAFFKEGIIIAFIFR